jgi:hypothetical protein
MLADGVDDRAVAMPPATKNCDLDTVLKYRFATKLILLAFWRQTSE